MHARLTQLVLGYKGLADTELFGDLDLSETAPLT
jgi:hypothetical protein